MFLYTPCLFSLLILKFYLSWVYGGKKMKHVRLISNLVIEDNSTYTLGDIRVLSQELAVGSKLDASRQVNENYGDVNALFAAIKQITVDIATSSLVG